MQEIGLLAEKFLKLSQLRSRKPKGLINWLADVSDALILREKNFSSLSGENISSMRREILLFSKSIDESMIAILSISREALEKLWRNGHFVKYDIGLQIYLVHPKNDEDLIDFLRSRDFNQIIKSSRYKANRVFLFYKSMLEINRNCIIITRNLESQQAVFFNPPISAKEDLGMFVNTSGKPWRDLVVKTDFPNRWEINSDFRRFRN